MKRLENQLRDTEDDLRKIKRDYEDTKMQLEETQVHILFLITFLEKSRSCQYGIGESTNCSQTERSGTFIEIGSRDKRGEERNQRERKANQVTRTSRTTRGRIGILFPSMFDWVALFYLFL